MNMREQEDRLLGLIRRVNYRGYTGEHSCFLASFKGHSLFVQHRQYLRCPHTGGREWRKGRKFYISPHMTDGEILRTLYLYVKLFEEHELNEHFKVDGELFLNPHPEGARKIHND